MYLRSPKAGQGQHTSFGHHQTSPCLCKFLKDLCTIKKGLGIEKTEFLTEQVSAIIQSRNPVKYKDPGSPKISVNIGGNCIDKSLLDLGASVNLLPYSVYSS